MLKRHWEADLAATKSPFPHQLEAFEAVKDLSCAAIFHEQGLGKTKIGLDLALSWLTRDIVDSVLIVAKKGLVDNWCREVTIHSHLNPRVLSQDRNSNFYAFNSPARLYIIHYEAVVSERHRLALFLRTRRVGAILDEAHKIKNPDTAVSQALHALASGFTRRVIMTGTPIANRPYDLWSQVFFLDEGDSLGREFTVFKNSLDITSELGRDARKADAFASEVERLFSRIRHFSIRETKTTSGLKLPCKTIHNQKCELEPRQAEIYAQFRDDLAATVVQGNVPIRDDAEVLLKRLLRLVQVASNPATVDDSYHATPGKFVPLLNLVHAAVDAREKIVVWTTFRENAKFLQLQLEEFGATLVHGGLSTTDRQRALDDFTEDSECRVLVATPASAKEGLTLTVANHAVFFDRNFSLEDYLQAQDRIHRISQEKSCHITNLVACDTIDVWVDALLAAKHLAAQLGQGDIARSEYETGVDYTFGKLVREVLRLKEGKTP